MKKKSLIVLLLALVLTLAACGGGNAGNTSGSSGSSAIGGNGQQDSGQSTAQPEAKKQIEINLGHSHPPESQFHLGAQKFAELVSEKTNNEINVQVFHSGQIGDEGALAEGIRMGTIDMALLGASSIAKFDQEVNIFNLPYIFRDGAHADTVLMGEVGDIFKERLLDKGVRILSFWESGFRHFVNSKREVRTPEDMKGLQIRTPENPVTIGTVKGLGANPVPLGFNELYMALKQGTVDGQEGPVFAQVSNKFYEVQKYMVLDGHIYTVMGLAMNPKLFDSLTDEQKQMVLEAADEAGMYERQLIRDSEEEELKFLESEGMIIVRDVDKEAWRNATLNVYETEGAKFDQELIRKIIETK